MKNQVNAGDGKPFPATLRKKPELLAPAGNPEKLQAAIRFGADAVYLAGDRFGLRAGAGNFTLEEMASGIDYAHEHGCKVYLAINLLAHNQDMAELPDWLEKALATKPDAVIVADPGVMTLVREYSTEMPIHLSTQANATNAASARFWHAAGVRRIVLARELSLEELAGIRADTPDSLELEAFVHGAMCMSYSGRCMLSIHLTGRDANRGDCAQPCRWSFQVTEAHHPENRIPVEVDERGTYLFNSKDLCLLRHLPALMSAGIGSLKIEGRMKSAYYVATIVKAYREAIDAAFTEAWDESLLTRLEREVASVSNREFTEGFLLGKAGPGAQRSMTGGYTSRATFVALVPEEAVGEQTEEGWCIRLEQRNHFRFEDPLEYVPPQGPSRPVRLLSMKDKNGNDITTAPHAQMALHVMLSEPVPPGSMIRRPNDRGNTSVV